ncbi:MAG: hypothetical protein FJW40_10395 [Acidobacteria bacterium]|nr:hypothetical protein [Acidobacteriota bacterium]
MTQDKRVLKGRFEVTGRLKIPYSPFQVGFSTNSGPGRDEFQLFAGTRIDLTRVLSKIAPNLR